MNGFAARHSAGREQLLGRTKRHPCGAHALHLPGRELEHAGILRVVHEVENRIESGLRSALTAIATDRTVERRRKLCRRVGNQIALVAAFTVERVEEREPVPHFVRGGISFAVDFERAAGKRAPVDDYAVEIGQVRSGEVDGK